MRPEKHSTSSCLDGHPLLWRGNQISHHIQTLSSGHPGLDDVLPGNGWPVGAVTELVYESSGCGELSLLFPSLAELSINRHRIALVDPPWIPYPPALYGHGLALEKLLLIHTQSRKESLWACEQVVRGIPGGAMLAWPDELSFSELRRLQLAAKNTQKTVFLFRQKNTTSTSSPAELRLQLDVDDGDLLVSVLKCRGQRPSSNIRIRRSQLFHRTTATHPAPAKPVSVPRQESLLTRLPVETSLPSRPANAG